MNITVLGSGSQGNATIISSNGNNVMIDAGFFYKHLKNRAEENSIALEDIDSLLLTHEHGDHVRGLELFAKRHDIKVFMSRGTLSRLSEKTRRVLIGKARTIKSGDLVEIAGMTVEAFNTSHDACEPLGYTLTNGKAKIMYVTDSGKVTSEMKSAAAGSTTLILESNYDPDMLWGGSYPQRIKERVAGPKGHLSNGRASEFIDEIFHDGLRNICLAHISQENNRKKIAVETVADYLDEEKLKNINLWAALQNTPGETFEA